MKELFRIQFKNPAFSMLLVLLFLLLSLPIYSQTSLTAEMGSFDVWEADYKNDMNVYWDINIGIQKKIKFTIFHELSLTTADYINIYEVDNDNNAYLIGTYAGSAGSNIIEISTTIRTGKARVEFITDSEDSYSDNPILLGMFISYVPDEYFSVFAPNGMEVKYNTKINGNLEMKGSNCQLLVKGKIKARNVEMTMNGWADYVFDKDYKLTALTEVNQYISSHKHLPSIPSATEVKEKGVNVSEMQVKLLQKVEELTLYIIQHQKDIDGLRKDFNQ